MNKETIETILYCLYFTVSSSFLVLVYIFAVYRQKKIKKLKLLLKNKDAFIQALIDQHKDELKQKDRVIYHYQGCLDLMQELSKDYESELLEMSFQVETLKAKLNHKKMPKP